MESRSEGCVQSILSCTNSLHSNSAISGSIQLFDRDPPRCDEARTIERPRSCSYKDSHIGLSASALDRSPFIPPVSHAFDYKSRQSDPCMRFLKHPPVLEAPSLQCSTQLFIYLACSVAPTTVAPPTSHTCTQGLDIRIVSIS